MLKQIPPIIPPELMKIMMEMGHGDELLLCDGNYPRNGSPERCVRMDGHGVPEILDAILVSAGKVGYQVELAPADLIALVGGSTADLTTQE